MKPLSLTLRLFFSLTFLILITLLLVALLGLRSANKEITEDYDAQLITESQVLWQITQEDLGEGVFKEYNIEDSLVALDPSYQQELSQYAQWRGFRIWKNGKVILQSDNTDDMLSEPATVGFHNFTVNNDRWRVFALHAPDDVIVESFENLKNREILQHDILLGIVDPSLWMLPILGLLLFFGIRYGLRKLRDLASTLDGRSPTDLSRLPVQKIATELMPLVNAVNGLLNKLEASLAREREFTDHAAHELRTPLTTLKLQTQLITKNFKAADRTPVDELLASVDRTTRLVDQLLLLARLSQQPTNLAPVNLFEEVHLVIALYATRALDKKITFSLTGDDNLYINTQVELLHIMIGTLLDNAIKYTPISGEINIRIENQNTKPSLIIQDTGPGIAEIDQAQVFNRFYRGNGLAEPGSGLGLAIAQQIAELHQASIHLTNMVNATGLMVRVIFQNK